MGMAPLSMQRPYLGNLLARKSCVRILIAAQVIGPTPRHLILHVFRMRARS